MIRTTLLTIALLTAPPLAARDTLTDRVEARLAEAGKGVRYGLVVTDMAGREIVAIRPDDRFIPASNTKILTTAAAFATMTKLDAPDAAGGASVRIEKGDVILTGRGDARLSSAADCTEDCLVTLAGAVAARTKRVRDVVGDASLFPDERWSPGMSWNNIQSRYGTATAAVTLDDNELAMTVSPGAPGSLPEIDFPGGYYAVQNRAVTVPVGETALDLVRAPNDRTLILQGTIAANAKPEALRMSIDDPAHYAAWRLKALLEERGVKVTGEPRSRYRTLTAADDPAKRGATPPRRAAEPQALARLTPPPLQTDLRIINKDSQNLHAELLLRRVGLVAGSGSIADGQAQVRAMLARAGVPRHAYDFSDGSGMSTYNRISPRGMTALLRWIAAQPWAGAFRETLPIAGVDGTLARRFKATPLEGKLFAKTGTLNASNALAGYMTAKSGRTLIFAAYANDVPEDVRATVPMDAALALVAEAN